MKHKFYQDEVVWIIGASSGIGEALAQKLAARGARLALSARRQEALEKLKRSLKGEQHKVFCVDVTDLAVMAETAKAIQSEFGCIDRVIFLAGAYTPMQINKLDLDSTRKIIEVNLLGAFHTINAVLPILKSQPNGQLALCGSVSSYIGLPGGQPYSATKAGITNLAESMVTETPDTVDIKLISPGFVRTDMTDKNTFKMPMIIEAEQAAQHIADGLLKGDFEIHFPKKFTRILKFIRLLPYCLGFRVTRKFKA